MTFEELKAQNEGKTFTFEQMIEFMQEHLSISTDREHKYKGSCAPETEVTIDIKLGDKNIMSDSTTIYG